MTAIVSRPNVDDVESSIEYTESVIRFNVNLILNQRDEPVSALSKPLDITRQSVYTKMQSGHWSVPDLIKVAKYFGTSPEALMDDSLMRQQTEMLKKIGISTVRYLLMPDACAPARIRTEDPRLKRNSGISIVIFLIYCLAATNSL